MTGVLVAEFEPNSPEWTAFRNGGIGGSDISALFGLSKYKSPWQLWAEKVGLIDAEEEAASEAAYWGNVLQPIVAAELGKRAGLAITPADGTYQHSQYEWALFNPDYLAYDKSDACSLVEIKTASAFTREQWEDDGVPNHAMLQVQYGMFVMGLPGAYVGALIGGQEFVMRQVARDDELIKMIVDACAAFWQRVVTKNPPPVDGTETTTKALTRAYGVDEGKAIELVGDFRSLYEQRQALSESIKAQEEERRRLDNELREQLGEAEVGLIDDVPVVSWKQNKNGIRSLRVLKAAENV